MVLLSEGENWQFKIFFERSFFNILKANVLYFITFLIFFQMRAILCFRNAPNFGSSAGQYSRSDKSSEKWRSTFRLQSQRWNDSSAQSSQSQEPSNPQGKYFQ